MRTGTILTMTTSVLGFLGMTLLISGPPLSSVNPAKWMQEERLEVLGASYGDLANAALPHEPEFTGDSPLQQVKVLGRRANQPGNSPEEKELNNLPKPIPPGQIRKASKAELLEQCNQIPKCSAKLQNAKQGRRPSNVLPAGKPGESPEEKEWSTLPKPIPPAPRRQPRSDLSLPEKESTLLSWLNPFAVSEARAQTAFSLYLTPQNRYSSTPFGLITIYGSGYTGSWRLYGNGFISVNRSDVEHKPYVYFATNVPAEGWYLINFEAGRGKAKVRHQYNGPIIETWDFTNQSCSTCSYLTAEYLTAGWHYFYFWPDASDIYFYSASVDSY
jgi:hypothetical protein